MRTLFPRLLAAMCGVAAAAMGVALFLQGRSLSQDLSVAADKAEVSVKQRRIRTVGPGNKGDPC